METMEMGITGMVTMVITKTIKLNTIMKKIFSLSALFLCAGLAVQAQTQNINQPYGMISQTCAEYTNNVNRTWNVNIGQNKKVKIEYDINTEAGWDKVTVYSINASGAATLLFTESGRKSGTKYSEFMTGKIQVVFTSDASISCSGGNPTYPQYTGFNLSFSAGDPIVAEAISGNLQGGALRVQTNYGNLDLGPQDDTYAHLSTDRTGFLFNKPIYSRKSLILGDDKHQYIFTPTWQANEPPRVNIVPKDLTTNTWDWSKQIILDNDGSILTSDGKLGVGTGTATPVTKLEVRGSVYLPAGNSYSIGSYLDSGNRLRMIHSGNYAYIDYAPDLHFRAGTNPVVSFINNGNVGIGITTPGVKLDVAGIIRAHEVKLCLNQGCDYVFADDYKLMNLNDLSNFIKTNKHLPEVTPAVEMEAEGISLSEMSALFLKKIEELTLYAIEQNKTIIDQSNAIEELKKEVKELKETR